MEKKTLIILVVISLILLAAIAFVSFGGLKNTQTPQVTPTPTPAPTPTQAPVLTQMPTLIPTQAPVPTQTLTPISTPAPEEAPKEKLAEPKPYKFDVSKEITDYEQNMGNDYTTKVGKYIYQFINEDRVANNFMSLKNDPRLCELAKMRNTTNSNLLAQSSENEKFIFDVKTHKRFYEDDFRFVYDTPDYTTRIKGGDEYDLTRKLLYLDSGYISYKINIERRPFKYKIYSLEGYFIPESTDFSVQRLAGEIFYNFMNGTPERKWMFDAGITDIGIDVLFDGELKYYVTMILW